MCALNNERDFNYAYVEPALELKLNDRWEWVAALREVNSIDGTSGQHAHKFITGPNLDLDQNNEIELRYVRGNGDKEVRSWVVEYVHSF